MLEVVKRARVLNLLFDKGSANGDEKKVRGVRSAVKANSKASETIHEATAKHVVIATGGFAAGIVCFILLKSFRKKLNF